MDLTGTTWHKCKIMILVKIHLIICWILIFFDYGTACIVYWQSYCPADSCAENNYCQMGTLCWNNYHQYDIFTWNSDCTSDNYNCSCRVPPRNCLQKVFEGERIITYRTDDRWAYMGSCGNGYGEWKLEITIRFPQWLNTEHNSTSHCFEGEFNNVFKGWVAIGCATETETVYLYSDVISITQATTKSTERPIQPSPEKTASPLTVTHLLTSTSSAPLSQDTSDVLNTNTQITNGSTIISLILGVSLGLLLLIATVFIGLYVYMKRRKTQQATDTPDIDSNGDTRYISAVQMEALNVRASISAIQRDTHEAIVHLHPSQLSTPQTDTPEYAVVNKKPCKKPQDSDDLRGPEQRQTHTDTSMQRSEPGPSGRISDCDVTMNQGNGEAASMSNTATLPSVYMNCADAYPDTGDSEYTRFKDNDLYSSG